MLPLTRHMLPERGQEFDRGSVARRLDLQLSGYRDRRAQLRQVLRAPWAVVEVPVDRGGRPGVERTVEVVGDQLDQLPAGQVEVVAVLAHGGRHGRPYADAAACAASQADR